MAIPNRALDASEQKRAFCAAYGAVATGVTLTPLVVPFNSTLNGIQISVAGLSGSPAYQFAINRFIVGTGVTTIIAGFTLCTPLTWSTSGMVTVVSVAAGNSLLQLVSGDQIVVSSSVANTAVTNLQVAICIQALQDIKTVYGN